MNIQHDVVQTRIHFFRFPAHARGVLRHFQAGGGDAAGVRGFTRREQYARFKEQIGGGDGGWHIGAFRYGLHAVSDQLTGGIDVQLVLRRARQRDIHRYGPRLFAFQIGQAKLARVIRYAAMATLFNVDQARQFFFGEACLVDDGAVRVGRCNHPRAKLHRFLDGVLRHVARAGNRHASAFKAQTVALKHRFGEVNQAIAGGFRTNQAAAEGETFAGKYAGAVVRELTHHPGHKADFTTAYADITGRHVGIRPQMTIQFGHQRLAETHDFAVALAFRIEIAAAFTAAHRQGGQGVFEGLFKAKEFQNRQVYGGVKTHTALVRADGGVELHAPCAVNLNLVTVINPNDAELDSTLRFNQTFQQIHLAIARIFLKEGPQGGHDLDRAVERGRENLPECTSDP